MVTDGMSKDHNMFFFYQYEHRQWDASLKMIQATSTLLIEWFTHQFTSSKGLFLHR